VRYCLDQRAALRGGLFLFHQHQLPTVNFGSFTLEPSASSLEYSITTSDLGTLSERGMCLGSAFSLEGGNFPYACIWTIDPVVSPWNPRKYCRFSYPGPTQPIIMMASLSASDCVRALPVEGLSMMGKVVSYYKILR
jgi:hypothetical protein